MDTDRARDSMKSPCQLIANLPEPSHGKAWGSFSASDVVATTVSCTMVGHGQACRSGSGSS